MDQTTYRISSENQEVHVNFDLQDQENCCIELSFTKDDVLSIINMGILKKKKIDLAGIEGVASLGSGNADADQICFSYRNGRVSETGTVFYSYKKLSALLNEVFSELNSK